MFSHCLHKLDASVRAGCLSRSEVCVSEGNDRRFQVSKRIQELVCKGAEGRYPFGSRWQSVKGTENVTLDITSPDNY